MQARIRIADLPETGRPLVSGWQLSHEVDGERRSLPLADGEYSIGSGSEADVRICAPGVRSRHLRLKCDGASVYVQPLGNAAVMLDGSLVRGLTRVNPAQPIRFGSVCAWIEQLSPEDGIVAVSIAGISVPPPGDRPHESAVASLEAINAALEESVRAGMAPTADRLLEALEQCQAPISAALFRVEGGGRAVLAERARPGAPTGQALIEDEEARIYSWSMNGSGRELAVLYSESSSPAWQDQLARQILLLSALSLPAANAQQPASTPSSEGAAASCWHRLVGGVLRAELARSTEMCRCADSVLLLGETGTGKELAARSLHELWGRSGEFIALNCAAIPGELLDAEFFGIEPGTATGVSPQAGRIEQARGGTLFLDEISEMPLALQSKLLRVLQEREYFRLGGAKVLKADVKIVAASNHSEDELRGTKMREDLYFRLAQAKLVLPPLRNRSADIAALAEHFLTEMENRRQHGIRGLSVSALEALKEYTWPGNVRELQNVLRAAYVCAPRGGLIQRAHLPPALLRAPSAPAPAEGTLASLLDRTEREAIERELARHERVPDAARKLGVSESYLYRLMKKHGIPARR